MIPNSILWAIEDSKFTASLGVVSTPRAFDEAISKQPSVIALLGALKTTDDIQLVADRARQLLRDDSNDVLFAHPYDLPVAIYLRALDVVDPQTAATIADVALQESNLWWSRAVAVKIASEPSKRIPVSHFNYDLTAATVFLERHYRTAVLPILASPFMTFYPLIEGQYEVTTSSSTGSSEMSPVPSSVRVYARAA